MNLVPDKRGSLEDHVVAMQRCGGRADVRMRCVFATPASSDVTAYFADNGVDWHELPEDELVTWKALARQIRAFEPDIVHFHFFSLSSVLLPLARHVAGCRVVLTFHTGPGAARTPEGAPTWPAPPAG